jgi:chromate reductase
VTRVLGICGSLRANSYNRELLAVLGGFFPDDVSFSIFDAVDVPVFNADLEVDGGPPSVSALKEAIANADLVVFATPEYNGSIPGSMKNLIDWASRAPDPLKGKPAAIIGGTTGRFGTAHAQMMLRHILVYLNCPLLPGMIAFAHLRDSFDGATLTDEAIRERLEKAAGAMLDWVAKVGSESQV